MTNSNNEEDLLDIDIEDEDNDSVVRVYSTELADFIVEEGGHKELLHDFDGVQLWECHLADVELKKSPKFIKMIMEQALNNLSIVFSRIRPSIYTIILDGEVAYGDVEEDFGSSLLLSRNAEKLASAVDAGIPHSISTWAEMKKHLVESKKDGVSSIAVLLGPGRGEIDYMEFYPMETAITVANSMLQSN